MSIKNTQIDTSTVLSSNYTSFGELNKDNIFQSHKNEFNTVQ